MRLPIAEHPFAWAAADLRSRERSLSICVLGVLTSLPAAAQNLDDLSGIASLTGQCEQLVLDGNNLRQDCSGLILQSIYKNGRTGFTVTVGDGGGAITFSGIEGSKPDANSQLQSVDLIILNLGIEGVPPTSTRVDGSCAYSNPYLGPMTISCQASDEAGGAFLLQFRTDGEAPIMTDLS